MMYAIFIRFITHIKKRRSVIRYLSCTFEAFALPTSADTSNTEPTLYMYIVLSYKIREWYIPTQTSIVALF